jgi:hypothetical protein
MTIIICMAPLITVLAWPTFGSLSQSAPGTDIRSLPTAPLASRSLSPAPNSSTHPSHPPAHTQSTSLLLSRHLGPNPFPLYNPHRTR